MSINILSDILTPAHDGSQVLTKGAERLLTSNAGPLPMVLATSSALGAIYFSGHMLNENRKLRTDGKPNSEILKKSDFWNDVAGLIVSTAGFVGAIHLTRLTSGRGR